MLDRLISIASNTFVETIRQPLFGVLLVVIALLLVMNIFLAGFTLDDDDKLLMDLGLSTMLLGGLFLSAFSATGVLTREIENKTVLTIISKPITRPVFLAGKYLGLFAAQLVGYYLSFLIFLLCMHHRVLQTTADPWDWPAILFGGGSAIAGIFIAAALNYFYGKEFISTCIAVVLPLLTVGTVVTGFFDREFNPASFGAAFGSGQIIVAAYLILLAISVIASIALAASTRLGQLMTLMACTFALILGLLSDWVFGQHQNESYAASVIYHIVPNFNYFWVVDAVTSNIQVPLTYVVYCTGYAFLWVVAILMVGVALFQRREVG